MPDGPGGFTQGSTCPALLRIPVCPAALRLRSCHPLRRRFPAASPRVASAIARSYYPGGAQKDRPRFGLFPVRSPLLGESLLFSLPTGTKMFQFPAFASVIDGWHAFSMPGCPIRISADQGSFAPPRGFSQLITSFVACKSLGIHRAPFLAFLSFFHHNLPQEGGGEAEYTESALLNCMLSFLSLVFVQYVN